MSVLIDKYGRQLTYLRVSVTDRCNFRCYYCMPEKGMTFVPRKELLTFEELHVLSAIFCSLGVRKIRITGGEPFVRNNLTDFLAQLRTIPALDELTITTNGTLLNKHITTLDQLGIRKINLSLDSLSRQRFYAITRRDEFEKVYETIFELLAAGFEIKINCVLAANTNTDDIVPFIELTKHHALSVRFLEEMPFNGGDHEHQTIWNYKDIHHFIQEKYRDIQELPQERSSTSINYRIAGYKGQFGIIPAFSRTFCGTCNRLRLAATGELRTCLYGAPAVNLRELMRSGVSEGALVDAIIAAVANRREDGFAAEIANQSTHKSMSLLGG